MAEPPPTHEVVDLLDSDMEEVVLDDGPPNEDQPPTDFDERGPDGCTALQHVFDYLLAASRRGHRHLWHTYPLLGQRALYLLSVPGLADNDLMTELTQAWADGMSICTECIDAYYTALDGMRVKYVSASWQVFVDMLRARDVARLTMALEFYIGGAGGGGQAEEYIKHVGGPFYEILSHPYLLRDTKLNDIFAKGVEAINHLTVNIALPDKLPGLFLLLVHPHVGVRHWAFGSAQNYQLGPDDLTKISIIIWEYYVRTLEYDQFGDEADPTTSHMVSPDRGVFWTGLYRLLRMITPEGYRSDMASRLAHTIVDIVVNQLALQDGCLLQGAMCFAQLLSHLGEELWEWANLPWDALLDSFFRNPTLQNLLSQPEPPNLSMLSSSQQEEGRSEEGSSRVVRSALSWLAPCLVSLPRKVGKEDAERAGQQMLGHLLGLARDESRPMDVRRAGMMTVWRLIDAAVDKDQEGLVLAHADMWVRPMVDAITAQDGRGLYSKEVGLAASKTCQGVLLHDLQYLCDVTDTRYPPPKRPTATTLWAALCACDPALLPLPIIQLLLTSFGRIITGDEHYQGALKSKVADGDAYNSYLKALINLTNAATKLMEQESVQSMLLDSHEGSPPVILAMYLLLAPLNAIRTNTIAWIRALLKAISPQSMQALCECIGGCTSDPYNRLLTNHDSWLSLIIKRLPASYHTERRQVTRDMQLAKACLAAINAMGMHLGDETSQALDGLQRDPKNADIYTQIAPTVRPTVLLPLSSEPAPKEAAPPSRAMGALPGRRGTSQNITRVPASEMLGGPRREKPDLQPYIPQRRKTMPIPEDEGMDTALEASERSYKANLPRKTGSVALVSTPSKQNKRPNREPAIPKIELSLEELHQTVLSWDFHRMSDGEDPDSLLQAVGLHLQPIPPQFQSVQHYRSVFVPLLLVEVRQQLLNSKDEMNINNIHDSLTVKDIRREDNFDHVSFDYENWAYSLEPDDVVYVCPPGQTDKGSGDAEGGDDVRVHALGLVVSAEPRRAVDIKFFLHGDALTQQRMRAFSRCVRIGCKLQIAKLNNMVPVHRQYQALMDMDSYGLLKDLLQPRVPRAVRAHEGAVQHLVGQYNEPQLQAIRTAINCIGISMIQGPPGTGKTRTIVGLLGALFCDHPAVVGAMPKTMKHAVIRGHHTRVLLCAPSNAAIDELVTRIRAGLPAPNGKFVPKVVRVGNIKRAHLNVHDVLLQSLIDKEFEASDFCKSMKLAEVAAKESRALRDAARTKAREARGELELLKKSNGASPDSMAVLEERVRELSLEEKKLSQEASKHESTVRSYRDRMAKEREMIRDMILRGADIIACTLSGSGSDLGSLDVDCVIVDEAAQCVELETLIPLRYHTTRCVLVGDPNQLPATVMSALARRYSYDQSLFKRLESFFTTSTNVENPIQLLSIQYRMHPQISSFPSAHFYGGRLVDDESVRGPAYTQPYHTGRNLGPYLFLDVHEGRETQSSSSLSNMAEANIAVGLFAHLCRTFPSINFSGRVGIVTPYKSQMNTIARLLQSRFGPEIVKSVEVATVDSFQGREKDIIIFSCVRAHPSNGIGFLSDVRRMNVALTRAKYSLFVLGNAIALRQNDTWKAFADDATLRRVIRPVTTKEFPTPTNAQELLLNAYNPAAGFLPVGQPPPPAQPPPQKPPLPRDPSPQPNNPLPSHKTVGRSQSGLSSTEYGNSDTGDGRGGAKRRHNAEGERGNKRQRGVGEERRREGSTGEPRKHMGGNPSGVRERPDGKMRASESVSRQDSTATMPPRRDSTVKARSDVQEGTTGHTGVQRTQSGMARAGDSAHDMMARKYSKDSVGSRRDNEPNRPSSISSNRPGGFSGAQGGGSKGDTGRGAGTEPHDGPRSREPGARQGGTVHRTAPRQENKKVVDFLDQMLNDQKKDYRQPGRH